MSGFCGKSLGVWRENATNASLWAKETRGRLVVINAPSVSGRLRHCDLCQPAWSPTQRASHGGDPALLRRQPLHHLTVGPNGNLKKFVMSSKFTEQMRFNNGHKDYLVAVVVVQLFLSLSLIHLIGSMRATFFKIRRFVVLNLASELLLQNRREHVIR